MESFRGCCWYLYPFGETELAKTDHFASLYHWSCSDLVTRIWLLASLTPRKWVSFKCRWHTPLHLLLHVHLLASRMILVDALWTPVLDLKLLLLWLISAVLLFSWTSDDNGRIPGQVDQVQSWNYLIKKTNITRYNSFNKKKLLYMNCKIIYKKIHDLVLFKVFTTNI